MANLLPEPVASSDLPSPVNRKYHVIAAWCLERQIPFAVAAKKIAKGNRMRKNRIERKLHIALAYDPALQQMIAAQAKGIMMTSLTPATVALGQRAARGRPDATKLLYEASGFHNPRVQHDHSGEIKVSLNLPRPKSVDSTAEEEK